MPLSSTVEKIVAEWLHKAEEDFKSAVCRLGSVAALVKILLHPFFNDWASNSAM